MSCHDDGLYRQGRDMSEPANTPARPRPLPRWTRYAVWVASITYAAYLLLGNLLLNHPVGRQLANWKPEKVVAGWSSAWTLYPGHVHVTDLRIAGHVRRTVWSAQADEASGRLSLLPLLKRELRIPSLRASGVSGGASFIDVVRLPPEPRPGGWTIRFDHIVAEDVRYAYLDDLVLAGKGSAEAGFVKVLRGGPMEVLPSHATLSDGVAWWNGSALAREATIATRFSVDRHLRAEAPGILKLGKTDLELEIEATPAGLSIEAPTGAAPAIQIVEGPGSLGARLHWRRGAFEPGSGLQLTVPVRDDLEGRVSTTLAHLALAVTPDELHLTGLLAPSRDASLRANADLRVRGRDVPIADLESMLPRTSGKLTGQWHFRSLAWLASLVPGSRLISFDGAGRVNADLDLKEGHIAAGSIIEVPRVAATAMALGNRFTGEARAEVRFEAAQAGKLRPRLDLTMDRFEVAPADAPGQPYVSGRSLAVQASTEGELGDLRDRFDAHLEFSDAEIPDFRTYNRYLPRTRVQIEGGTGRLSGDLYFDSAGNVGRGTLTVVGRDVQLGIAGLTLQGDLALNTRLRRADLADHAFTVDGSRLSLEGVRVSDADGPIASDWWAQADLDDARLDWDKPMSLDSQLSTRLKDVSVLLGVYSRRKDLPGWVSKVVDVGEANARGRVRWQGDTLLLAPFEVRNERFDVEARLRLHRKQLDGDLFTRWGVLSLGVELAEGGKKYHLAGARKWFDAQPVLGLQ